MIGRGRVIELLDLGRDVGGRHDQDVGVAQPGQVLPDEAAGQAVVDRDPVAARGLLGADHPDAALREPVQAAVVVDRGDQDEGVDGGALQEPVLHVGVVRRAQQQDGCLVLLHRFGEPAEEGDGVGVPEGTHLG